MELKREVIERKKDISLSIETTIKDAMVPYYESKQSLTIFLAYQTNFVLSK